MKRIALPLILLTVAALAVMPGSSSATAVNWTLAKRFQYTFGPNFSPRTANTTVGAVNGLAISGHTASRSTFLILVGGTCTNPARITSHGLGTKVPLTLKASRPKNCSIQTIVDAPSGTYNSKAVTLSIWKR